MEANPRELNPGQKLNGGKSLALCLEENDLRYRCCIVRVRILQVSIIDMRQRTCCYLLHNLINFRALVEDLDNMRKLAIAEVLYVCKYAHCFSWTRFLGALVKVDTMNQEEVVIVYSVVKLVVHRKSVF
jgi:hypothetical protein